jgi:arylsulfatase A-like enzyme/outer membrane protein assembly factor BamB
MAVLLRLWVALTFSVLVWATPHVAFAADQQKPNIVLIYADDLGYGDLSCYGANRVQTPHIDRLAREGLRFRDAHCSSSTCTPSRYSMLTGEYAWRRRGTGVLPGDAPLIIEPGRVTLPSVLHRAGYQTGLIGKWHLGLGRTNLNWNSEIKPGPLEVGFDYCFLMPATGDRVPCVYVENHRVVGLNPADPLKVSFAEYIGEEPTGKDHPELLKLRPSHGHDQTIINGISRIGYSSGGQSARWVDEDMADTYVKKATEFIERNKSSPFFLYFATHDIHVPRVPNARFAGRNAMGPRGDVIVELDWCVGELLAVLERNGLATNTIVIFTSDNGPVVDDGYQDGAKDKLGDHRPAGPLRGGKYSIFEGGSRIPFVVRWGGHVVPGVSDALISQVDFVATFAALAGQSFDTKTAPDSQNVLPALLGRTQEGRATLVEHSGGIAFRQGDWKFIPVRPGRAREPLTDTDTGNSPRVQLYDLKSDLGETNNLAEANPEKVGEFENLLEKERAKGRPDRVDVPSGDKAPSADDWPQFRGPTGDGISLATNVPLTWSPTQNVKWKVPVPGRGRCSPVLLGDRIWLTTALETNVRTFAAGPDRMQQAERVVIGVVCLERATGKQLYHTELFPVDNPPAVNFLNSYATPTPVVEPGRLYCDFGTFGTACLDSVSGEVLWKRELPLDHHQGPGSSPALYKNLLILVRDGRDQQYVTALDKQTGKTVWRNDRPPLSTPIREFRKSFSTPFVFEAAGQVQMVVPGAQWFVSYEPETGKEIWRVDDGKGETVAPRPVYGNGLVYLSTGVLSGKAQLWAVRVDGQGDVTRTHVAWKLPNSIGFMASPLLVDHELYLLSDDGFVTCVDALSGEILGKVRAGGNYAASPTHAEGRIYCFSREGKTIVFRANRELTVLAENQLDGPVFASPAFTNSAIYLRTDSNLYCLSIETAHSPD